MSGLILGVIPMTHTPGLLFAAELLTNGAVMIALGLSVRRLQLA